MSKQRTIRNLTIGGAAAAALALGATTPAAAETAVPEPDSFTSAFIVEATPDQVVANDGTPAPGEPDATGTFEFRINSDLEIICYDITLNGVTGEYSSPAKTATHIHEAAVGAGGPPRIAFPNPVDDGTGTETRTASGCLQGPFTTGLAPDGTDTGTGFTLAQIEANPAGFTGDTHTADYLPGAVRGQLVQVDLPVDPEPTPEPTPDPTTPTPAPSTEAPAPGTDDDTDDRDTLAETGVEPGEIAGFVFGGLAIAAGAGLVIARRRAERA